MENYIFSSNWIRINEHVPTNGTRCLVTDGDVVVIATYVDDGSNVHWIFTGVDSVVKEFKVAGWMDLPKPLKLTD